MESKNTPELSEATTRRIAIGVVIAVVVLILALVGYVISAAQKVDLSTDNSTQQAAEAKPVEDKTFDVTVERTIAGLSVTNNEATPLTSCTVGINDKFDTEATIQPQETKVIPWGVFTDDGKRFSIEEFAVEKVYVNLCDGQESRFVEFTVTTS